MSVLNLQLNLTEVLKSKEELIFQVGFHRFQAKPILSEVSSGNKHKVSVLNNVCTLYGNPVFFKSSLPFHFTDAPIRAS
jgi:hypothetical protein